MIGRLETMCREKTASLDAVYEEASAILDIAGLFDKRVLCDACYSLCELVDRQRTHGRQEWTSIGVHVSALCPGFTYSEFHDVNDTREQISRSAPEWMWLGADEVAAAGYEAAEANRPICVPGAPSKAIAAAVKLIPDEWALALMASQGPRFRGRV